MEKTLLYKIKNVDKYIHSYHTEMEKKIIRDNLGMYFRTDGNIIENRLHQGSKEFYGILLDGWNTKHYFFIEDLELIPYEKDQYTICVYSGMGGILDCIEVKADYAEKAMEEAIKVLYKKFGNEENHYYKTANKIEEMEKDPYYQKDYKKWKRKQRKGETNFGDFLIEEYNYMYFDVEDTEPLYLSSSEHLRIEEGWGIYANSTRYGEELL